MDLNTSASNDTNDNGPEMLPEPLMPKNRRKRNIAVFIVVTLINIGLLALLWSQLLTPAQTHSPDDPAASVAGNPLIGHPAPNFTLTDLSSSHKVHISDFKGKAVVLNFWSSSCGPCAEEAPMLQSNWQKAQAHNIIFLGVDFQDDQGAAQSFMQKYGITYPNIMDADGSTAITYGVVYTPSTFFVNAKGVIVSWMNREMTAKELQQNLKLLG